MHNIQRSPLYHDGYKPIFSGHETFPLRYGWLKKAYDAIAACDSDALGRDVFTDDSAIGRFGVGKNMVTSMRHWATCCGIIADTGKGQLRPTSLGDLIFGTSGLDPYLEKPATLWLLHWQLASYDGSRGKPNKTTWQWIFNHFPGLSFEKEDVVQGITKVAEARGWSRLAPVTIRNDVDCFIRTYESRQGEKESIEDAISSPLAELALVRGHYRRFQLIRGPKSSLPNGVFIIALEQFWRRLGSNRTLSFETIAHEPGSPGRVFLLDETDLAERLLRLEEDSNGAFKWSETAGLKQVLRLKDMSDDILLAHLRHCLQKRPMKEAA